MARNREKNREKKKKKKKMLSRQNEFGIQDPTPFEAVSLMINKERGGRSMKDKYLMSITEASKYLG